MTLGLRVLRGAAGAVLARWVLVAVASAGTGLLLLSCLGWALAHPQRGSWDAAVRLGWCAVPVVVTAQLAAAVGRAQSAAWPRPGLAAVGLGRTATVLLGAVNSAVACALGSVLALLVFLQLRGDVLGPAFHGAGSGLLAAGTSLPLAGAATLLALVPVAAAATGAAGLRPFPVRASGTAGHLPWGVALTAVGLAVEVTAPKGHEVPLPSGFGTIAPLAALGWAVTTAGLMLAGPGLVHGCGRALALHRPGAGRLLAGRALQTEAPRIGRPLGLLAATASACLAVYDTHRPVGPVTTFAACLIAVCVLAVAALAFAETARDRAGTALAVRALGGPAPLLWAALALRAAALLTVFAPLTALVAYLATIPTPHR
ncbi:hypothetical protein [Actinacidiphila acididurans]|uniref:Integral membrane protein n=1 Tax=Actinacidiphila acididurans TaxID=2784346 RepID=A0ABS2TKU4_9ACTN|nr:hypothetical protein [Actinacidiphila acididurans]MBM9503943.1 hypothetical protein [Actinacidiphila acididurans]